MKKTCIVSVKVLLVALSTAAFLTCGDSIATFLLSDEDEVILGKKFKAEILADTAYPRFTGSEKVIRYVDSVGQMLANIQKDRDTLKFTFTIIDKDEEINAFAIPGGHVFIYTGLLLNAESGAEVAGVLAHEIGHITKYHGRNLLIQREAAGLVNSILFGDSSSVAGAVAGLLENMVFLGFSRDNEFQADSCAVAYTTTADVNPIGMRTFLQKLRAKYGEQPVVFEPFSTHPPLTDRIDKVQKVIGKFKGAAMGEDVKLFADEFLAVRALIK